MSLGDLDCITAKTQCYFYLKMSIADTVMQLILNQSESMLFGVVTEIDLPERCFHLCHHLTYGCQPFVYKIYTI